MSKKRSAIELSSLQLAAEEHNQQLAVRQQQEAVRQQQGEQMLRREDSAWPLLDLLTSLAQQGGAPFDRASELIDAFFAVCEVMREQELGPELDTIDEKLMVHHYRQGRSADLAMQAYQAAIRVLKEGIAKGNIPALRKELVRTVESAELRHLWSMVYVLVQGLLTNQGRLYRKTEVTTIRGGADVTCRRPCYARDHLWLQWATEGMGIAAIRDRWNREYKQHGGHSINKVRAGRDVVKEGLRKARKEQQGKA